ncbi:glycosyl transferase [Ammoniphilus oxalaticus]|uniref:Glycosyl transferase n=1 Tax=Ammoniphilus oxalaticus TaxID=66863 RepID=A0A419SL01_9BACL|nr:glycosyltransferase family 2 protein [Ammoniphilus oxalaticus]RKD24606.1 glycosyl transferase [Ammoniphilus oxalaticus]
MSKLSIIIPTQDEEQTISSVIEEAKKLSPLEIIVVINGSSDNTKQIVQSHQCKIIEYPFSIGNDVGRAIGALHANGDILLFIDGDIPIPSNKLFPFVREIQSGSDIALNNLRWTAQLPIRPHTTTVSKIAVNHFLRASSLSVNSLIAIPHAMSKVALEKIGWHHLADPVLAQAIAIEKKLKIASPIDVDVIGTNRIRPVHSAPSVGSPYPQSTSRILGDHLRAIQYLIEKKGPRGGFTDGNRNRKLLQRFVPHSFAKRAKRSAVIPVGEEKRTISQVISSVRQAGVDEIIVVANGADRDTLHFAQQEKVLLVPFGKQLGHNVGRAIGAAYATGEICLFIDGDFVIPPDDLIPFIQAVEGGVDIALNNLEFLMDQFHPMDTISVVKYFLNLSAGRPDLLNNSLTAVPHAMHRRVIDKIGFKSLMIPPKAQVEALQQGFKIQATHVVDVVKPNRIRQDHVSTQGKIPAFERIIGDHVEALGHLLHLTNHRGLFTDGNRKRELLKMEDKENDNI